jgi:hypothetical protein
MSSLTKENPFDLSPEDFSHTRISPDPNFSFFKFSFSIIPTEKPAKSYLPLGKFFGCSAVSPPIREQLEFLHPFGMPEIISLDFFKFILSVIK